MKHSVLTFVFFILCAATAHAQLFLPIDDDPFGVPVRFNSDSIRYHRIRSITSNIRYKPDNQIIQDKGLKEYYQFDSIGRIEFYWRTRVKGQTNTVYETPPVYRKGRMVYKGKTEIRSTYTYDTLFVYYYYDKNNRLNIRRMCEGEFYNTWYYEYNEDGFVTRQIHTRETNSGLSHRSFRMGIQTVVSVEEFRYMRLSDDMIKQYSLNDEGRSYKETIMKFDKKKRPLEYREEYAAGGIRVVTSWSYDTLGRTATISYSSNAGNPVVEVSKYNYDSLGRIESLKRYKNDVLYHEFSYLYEANAPVAYAYINRRHVEMAIDIVKMEIVRFGEPVVPQKKGTRPKP
ncbi:MAG: hypothetical protein Fur0041_19540 [Bacteroidia bacterium]